MTEDDDEPHRVSYPGFLQFITRDFPSRAEAEQWLRQVGKARDTNVTIERIKE